MHSRSIVIHLVAIVGAEVEHACQWRNTDFGQIDAREQRQLHIKDRRIAWSDGETIRCRCTWAVELRVSHQRGGGRARPLYPEAREIRKLLSTVIRRANGQTSS